MWLSDRWKDYELLDVSGGERLERWGSHILVRPDPQAIWKTEKTHPGWNRPEGRYSRSHRLGPENRSGARYNTRAFRRLDGNPRRTPSCSPKRQAVGSNPAGITKTA